MTLKEFLEQIDFKNQEKLSAQEIGFDEDVDLVLRTRNGKEESETISVGSNILQEADELLLQKLEREPKKYTTKKVQCTKKIVS